jgi:hypothetical protein
MKKVNASKEIKSFDKFNSVLSVKNILCLQAMISVKGGDGDPILPPPPGKP